MATISTRIDDTTKAQAEKVASEIGITLSTAISIFLKQFVGRNGFPFDVVAPQKQAKSPVINIDELDKAVSAAVSNSGSNSKSTAFSYLDPKTNKIVRVEE